MPPRRNKRPPSWLEDYHVPAQKKGSRQRPQQQQASSSVPRRSVNVPVNIYGRFSDFLRDTTTETTIGNDRYLIPDVTEINNFSNNRDDVGNPTVDVVFVRNVNMVQQIRRSGRSRPFEIVATGAQRNITFNPVNTQGNNVTFTNGLQGRVQTANSDIARVQLPVSILDFNITPGGGTPVTAGTDAVVEYIAELAQNGLEYMRDVLLDMNTDYYFRITVYDANSNANMRLTVDRNFNTAYNLNYNSGTLPTDVSYPNRGLGRHDSRDRRYWTLIEATPRSALSNYRNPRGLIDYFERQSGTAAESLRNVSRGLSDVMRNYLRNYEEQGVSLNRIMIEALNPSDLTGNSGTPFTVIDYLNGRSVGGSSSGSSSSGVGWTGQKGNEVRIELHSKLIVVPETRTNCGYTSIAIGMMYERTPEILYDKKKQKSNGNKYKTKCGCSGEIKMNQEDATKISEKLGVTINMHFSDIHKPKWTVKSTKSNKQINLIVMNNHIGVIVDKHKVPPENLKKFKEELSITVEDSEFHKLASHLFTNDLYLEPIKDPSLKKPKDVFRNTKIAAFDIEAFEYDSFGNKIDQTPYLLGFGTFLSENPERSITDSVQYHVFEHTNSVVSFLRFLCDNYYVYDGYTIYAHNFAKYDSYVMFQNGLFEVPGLIVSDLITQNGGMIQMILKPSDDGKVKGIKFMDSARLIQGDLRSLLQEFKTPHQKLDLEHQKMTADTYMDNLEEAKTYLYNDVVGLLEMMEMFSISEWEESGINITNTITAASLSKKTFFYNFYPKCLQKGWNLYHLPEWLDSYIRRGYFGGRNECFKLGEFNTPIRYYDFTSLYPYVSTFPVPCGLPRVVTEESEVFDEDGKILDSFTGFVRCYVKGPAPDQRPLHALVHNNKLMFPRVISDGVEFLIFSEEIRFAQKLGLEYDYNFKDAVYFELQPILKEFMEFCFAQKAEQKKLGNDMKSKAYKIKVNSGYGVFGLKTKFRDSVKIMNYDPEDSKNIQKINK
ncbi:MAG: hypothetical protein IM488_01655, partial [Microcystis sp. M025S2]|uniref:DNA polymerase n=1 Tax=Microcystis sp. M025S2 TaxID=2771161 RepID=UPI00258CC580